MCHGSMSTETPMNPASSASASRPNSATTIDYADRTNKEMAIMRRNSLAKHLATNRRELPKFFRRLDAESAAA